MRTPLIAANWKMNTRVNEAIELVKEIQPELRDVRNIEKVICPPFISLIPVFDLIKGTETILGAQNLYFEEKGAFTGEISPLMLADYCQYVIIGHSERRQFFNESNEIVNKKIMVALKHHLKPILCVGENLKEFEAGKTNDIVINQIKTSLEGINDAEYLTVAYEPIWAIGTGKAATGNQANLTINLIRNTLKQIFCEEVGDSIRILYGGSVTATNIVEFVSQTEIDGALVGGASLKSKEFISIVKTTAEVHKQRI
jgi:triosephosphate isomerase (TIM)